MKGGNRVFPNHFVPYWVNIGELLLAKGDRGLFRSGESSSAGNEDHCRQKPLQMVWDGQWLIHNTEAILN